MKESTYFFEKKRLCGKRLILVGETIWGKDKSIMCVLPVQQRHSCYFSIAFSFLLSNTISILVTNFKLRKTASQNCAELQAKTAQNCRPKLRQTASKNCAKPRQKTAQNCVETGMVSTEQTAPQNCAKPRLKTAQNCSPKLRRTAV